MKSWLLNKVPQILGAACVMIASGCASVFVRSEATVKSQHVFPATTFDGQFFWNAGIQGEPLFATVDTNARNGPVTRVAYGIGAVVDLPFSIVFDTILLPVDLAWPGASNEGTETKDGAGNQSRPVRPEPNRVASPAGSGR